MKKNFKISIISIISIISLISLIFLTACNNQKIQGEQTEKFIIINNHKIYIEIANTSEKRAQGLSNHDSLPADHGMLFIFDTYQKPAFWMKDIRFPIDIIWIRDNIVVDITKNVSILEGSELKHYFPSQQVNYVLEVNSGIVEKNKIEIGQKIR